MYNKSSNLTRYVDQLKNAPILSQEEESKLADLWINHGNQQAAHKLVVSHLRLVYKIANDYSGYGLPVNDLLSEGTVGLMHAVKKFNPEKGARLATYAMLWIKAAIQEYILRSWSLVKIGTSAVQRKLFFNLRRLKHELGIPHNSFLSSQQVDFVSDKLGVKKQDVITMESRLMLGDQSLNLPVSKESANEKMDLIVSNVSFEDNLMDTDELNYRKKIIFDIITSLEEREREIFIARRISDPSVTLHSLSKKYNISRERVRQIEMQAFSKICQKIKNFHSDDNCLLLE